MSARAAITSILVAAVTIAAAMAGTSTAGAASTWAPIAVWEMNEGSGARTLLDSSGNGVTGALGSRVNAGVREAGMVVHQFPYISASAPADNQRLHLVSDRPGLDPGSAGFAVEVRFRTHAGNKNIMQKGQSTTAGGMWKVEVSGGRATCVFRGPQGSVGMKSTSSVEDDRWHVVRCERTSTGSALYLDGVRHARATTWTGAIDNSLELAIGGKSRCNNTSVSCDYFYGAIDYARIERLAAGATPTTAPPTTPPPTTAPTTTAPTTTSAPVPPVRLPSGSFDQVEVDGRTVRVRGAASDPDGAPVVQIRTTWDGRSATIERPSSGGRFDQSFTAEPGDHQVCISVLDTPTRQAVALGCRSTVVK